MRTWCVLTRMLCRRWVRPQDRGIPTNKGVPNIPQPAHYARVYVYVGTCVYIDMYKGWMCVCLSGCIQKCRMPMHACEPLFSACVCAFVCVCASYIRIHKYVHTRTHDITVTNSSKAVWKNAGAKGHTHTCIHVRTYIHTHAYICINCNTSMRLTVDHTHIYIQTHIHSTHAYLRRQNYAHMSYRRSFMWIEPQHFA
jgi:hypothetical protein